MDDETSQRLQQQDWSRIRKKLLAVAINQARSYRSLRQDELSQFALGQTCDDIVHDLILKTISGERHWDPKRGELMPWLKANLRSEIDNLANRKASQQEALLLGEDGEKEFDASQDALHAVGAFDGNKVPMPEALLIRQEAHEREITNLYHSVEGDEELESLVLTMAYLIEQSEELRTPSRRELAEAMGIPESEVDNQLKRLRRLLLKVRVS